MISTWFRSLIQWLRASASGRIFAATLVISASACVVKLISLIKEVLVARSFGAADQLDAFYIAILLPAFLIGIVATCCQSAFVPVYIDVRDNQGRDAAQRLFSSMELLNLLLMLILSVALALGSAHVIPLLGSTFSPHKLYLAEALFLLLLVSLGISGLNAFWRATLNADEHFAVAALSPLAIPLSISVLLLARASSWRIYALAIGHVLGVATEAVALAISLRYSGVRLTPKWCGFDLPVKQVLRQSAPAAAGALLMGSTALVDQSLAARLGPGSVSALNYANKLIPVILTIGTISLSTAALPAFSRLAANRDWVGVRSVLRGYTRLIFAVTVPVTILIILFSRPIIALFFQHGAFTEADAILVARVQSFLSVEIPFYAISMLYVSALSGLKLNDTLMWGTMISVPLNIGLDLFLMRIWGVSGIALSTAGVLIVSAAYLGWRLYRALDEYESLAESPAYAVASN